ncbi:site-specific integrase [bacterium]|jgi:site-specific recombinase XerD|nr:site-specific integrase [bacterium]MBT4334899.1 site-specific integrase [bacterium]MBT4495840.1 site-specific integrase [bacterium]MBT4763717.1 site-specific integrase [bacterium]MBT5401088.1 site-specific integrase [bacterium]
MPNRVTINLVLRKYIESLEARDMNEKTISNYSYYLNRFFKYSNITKPIDISEEKVKLFKTYLLKLKKNKTTINYHLIAIRSYLKYMRLNKKEVLNFKKVKLFKTTFKLQTTTKIKIDKLLEAPSKIQASKIIKLRDRAILEIIIEKGYKVSKIAKLDRKNLLKFSKQSKYYLNKYLALRTDDAPYLFIGHDRALKKREKIKALSPRSIQRLVEKYVKVSGLKDITPETLRHIKG